MKGIPILIALTLLAATPATGGKIMEEAEIRKAHRHFAVELNNSAWGLMDQAAEPSPEELDRLVDRAHASLYHWSVAGERVNLARGITWSPTPTPRQAEASRRTRISSWAS